MSSRLRRGPRGVRRDRGPPKLLELDVLSTRLHDCFCRGRNRWLDIGRSRDCGLDQAKDWKRPPAAKHQNGIQADYASPPAKPEPPVRNDAIGLLAALQREARFIDIVKEPLGDYSDAQVGAAARDVLRDCGAVLDRLFKLEPIVDKAGRRIRGYSFGSRRILVPCFG